MSIKKNFAVSILDFDKIADVNKIIMEHADITMRTSSFFIFDKQPIEQNVPPDITIFQIEAEDKKGLDEKLNDLIENLNKLNVDYALRDHDTGEMLIYLEFVGALKIKFDNLKNLKKDTYKKIDDLKDFKTDLGICKGYKPNFRPMESQSIENMIIEPESIYLYCHSQENLFKLKDLLTEKILEIDPDFEIDFRVYTEDDLH